MECMVGKRLQHLAESQGMLNPDQSGFCPQRSTEDQVIRLSQAISDGFQAKKPANRMVLALLFESIQQSLAGGSLGHNVEEESPGPLCTVDPWIPVQ
jgi:hypothetical protein